MNFFSAPEFKVGILVLVIAGIIAGMALSVSSDSSYLGDHKNAWFLIDDASGLIEKSGVRMAGIRVGQIQKIGLENGKARIDMILDGNVPVTNSVRIEIRPNGILGDKHVELISGDPRDPPLRSGDQILVVDDRASVDKVIAEVSKITQSLNTIAINIKAATEGDTDKPLGKIVANVERITSDLAEITAGQKENVGEILANLRDTTDTINELVNDESDAGLRQTWDRTLARIDKSVANVEAITNKINKGEGTIGKLINDETTVEGINTAIAGVNNFLDAGAKIQTSFDVHSNYLMNSSGSKTFLSVQIQPGLDRYYEVGVVDDGVGQIENVTSTSETGGVVTTTREERRFENRLKFNALFAKNFYDFTIKGGVIESRGGVAADMYALKRKLKLSLEAFDFTELNVRATARYNLFGGVYVAGGAENLARQIPGRGVDNFIGAGLFLTNDDLKLLLTRMPF
jgi:phospholipid/cholesterol/gamma-HCH transport system substrate-binding protein